MAKTATKETPLMQQYNTIKGKYPGALLLFRVGDFYETFGEDAVKASGILGIVLTKELMAQLHILSWLAFRTILWKPICQNWLGQASALLSATSLKTQKR